MSILDVTEDQIFHTLGKGRDPNFKPIEKARPVVPQPKKTYIPKPAMGTTKTVRQELQTVEPAKPVPSPEVEEAIKKFTEELNELNHSVGGIKTIVKWYLVPQFMIVLVLLALFMKSYLS